MFQKLYKHLEDINLNTREQLQVTLEGKETTERLSDQVEAVHRSLAQALAAQQAGSSVEDTFSRSRSKLITITVSALAVIILGGLAYFTFQLAKASRYAIDHSVESSKSVTAAFARYSEAIQRVALDEEKIVRLDSLISQQSRSISELKKLNATSVRTFIRIRNYLEKKNTAVADK